MRIFRKHFHDESIYGLALLSSVLLAFFCTNTEFKTLYYDILNTEFAIHFNDKIFSESFSLLVSDALMTIFFLSVALELKREITIGHLSHPMYVLLPAIGALGGVLEPAVIYYNFNREVMGAGVGWAIPTATDIVFSLAVLNLLGARVPPAARLFMLTLAIFDDVAAIAIIAFFYSHELSVPALWLGGSGVGILYILHRNKVNILAPYLLVGLFTWICVWNSGIHSTLAGVVIGAFIPINRDKAHSLLHKVEDALRNWVNLLIIPLFALCNSGLEIGPLLRGDIFNSITMGVALGLFVGKQMGIFLMCLAAVKLLKIPLPRNTSWGTFYGVCILGGVGFTMSLFIANLSFIESAPNQEFLINARLGIIAGSLLSAVVGALVILITSKKPQAQTSMQAGEPV